MTSPSSCPAAGLPLGRGAASSTISASTASAGFPGISFGTFFAATCGAFFAAASAAAFPAPFSTASSIGSPKSFFLIFVRSSTIFLPIFVRACGTFDFKYFTIVDFSAFSAKRFAALAIAFPTPPRHLRSASTIFFNQPNRIPAPATTHFQTFFQNEERSLPCSTSVVREFV